MNHQRVFFAIANQAIRAGRLTPAERDLLARVGTRKARYWARHLRDLREVLAERRAAGRERA